MIYYFSGTGNSKFIADCLADQLHEETINLLNILKSKKQFISSSLTPHIFIAPIYAWRYPKIIEELIINSELKGSQDVYCICTRESQSGHAGRYLEKIISQKNMNYKGMTSINMPNFYLMASSISTPEETQERLTEVITEVEDIANKINNHDTLIDTPDVLFPSIMSSVVNTLTNKFLMSSKHFIVSDNCINCHLCEHLCPTNNITIDKEPNFHNQCTWCFTCIQHCPKQAISPNEKSTNKPRYICPKYEKE